MRDLIQAAQLAIEDSDTAIIHDEDHESAEPAGPPLNRLDPLAAVGPAVSVIVPCYNDEGYVRDALESIRRQSVSDWECIVVDDGSTDRSVSQIQEAILGDTRFRLERHLKNRGVSAARNTGLDLASGRYVVFHDSDDLMMARSLEDRLRAIDREADPDIAGVFCGVRLADDG
ncbi:MAG: glycosyltransferase family 2 protein, partial [Acidimicrobiia bacterium]